VFRYSINDDLCLGFLILISSSMRLPAVVQDQAGETGVVDQANQALQMLHLVVRHLSYAKKIKEVKGHVVVFSVFWAVLLMET
jgi:hypothetical protein